MKRREELSELRALGDEELRIRAREASEELMKLRFRNATGQLESSHRPREVRRSIARALTVMQERTTMQEHQEQKAEA